MMHKCISVELLAGSHLCMMRANGVLKGSSILKG